MEEVRQRAKHRLIGTTVLVLAGVLVFPVLFDTQPRPIPVDIPIEIPSRQTAKPLVVPSPSPEVAVAADKSLGATESLVSEAPAAPAPAPTPATASAAPAQPAATASATAQPDPAPAEPKAAEATERFIVQVGAFADPKLAQQVRLKLERAGMKTYTHVANTPDGKRTRVRLGPFASRAEAEKAAAKSKALGVAPAILSL